MHKASGTHADGTITGVETFEIPGVRSLTGTVELGRGDFPFQFSGQVMGRDFGLYLLRKGDESTLLMSFGNEKQPQYERYGGALELDARHTLKVFHLLDGFRGNALAGTKALHKVLEHLHKELKRQTELYSLDIISKGFTDMRRGMVDSLAEIVDRVEKLTKPAQADVQPATTMALAIASNRNIELALGFHNNEDYTMLRVKGDNLKAEVSICRDGFLLEIVGFSGINGFGINVTGGELPRAFLSLRSEGSPVVYSGSLDVDRQDFGNLVHGMNSLRDPTMKFEGFRRMMQALGTAMGREHVRISSSAGLVTSSSYFVDLFQRAGEDVRSIDIVSDAPGIKNRIEGLTTITSEKSGSIFDEAQRAKIVAREWGAHLQSGWTVCRTGGLKIELEGNDVRVYLMEKMVFNVVEDGKLIKWATKDDDLLERATEKINFAHDAIGEVHAQKGTSDTV